MSHGVKLIAIIFALFLLSSCTAQKAYPGPELPDEQVALLKYYDSSSTYEMDYFGKYLDRLKLADSQSMVKVLPGTHHTDFAWSFETADDGNDSGLLTSWKKFGRCQISFNVEAGKEYTISARARSSGTWVSEPNVIAQVSQKCGQFLCSDKILTSAPCTYDGRSPSAFVTVDLGG